MRIHTNLPSTEIYFPAKEAAGVGYHRFTEHKSKTRDFAYEVRLTGSSPYPLQCGAACEKVHVAHAGYQDYAASWDQWGIWLHHVLQKDPEAHTGVYGYVGLDDFNRFTGYRFRYLTPAQQHRRHKWEWGGDVLECMCGAVIDRASRLSKSRRIVLGGFLDLSDPTSVDRWLEAS